MPGESGAFQLPWTAIPRFSPGVTDVTEYSSKLQFLAAMWPQEHLHLLAPRAALLCEGTAFKKVSKLSADKLKTADESGIKLLVSTLGGSWGKTALEEKYDTFEKAIYSTAQKADETNDSYLARHDVHFEELLAQGVTMEEVRAYVLLRQSQLSAEDRKKIVVEMGGKLEYSKVVSAIRLLGSRFFADLQGQRTARTKTYDANVLEEAAPDEPERAFQATVQGIIDENEAELDAEYVEAMVAVDDPDALTVQGFEEELEGFFQDTPDLQEALVSYLEARQKLLSKKRSRGFWPVSAGKGSFKNSKGSKGRGKGGKGGRDQLLARIARSHCRICGAKGHWKAECPQKNKSSASAEATTTVAEAIVGDTYTVAAEQIHADEVLDQVPPGAMSLAEALITWDTLDKQGITSRLRRMVANIRKTKSPNTFPARLKQSGAISLTEPVCPSRVREQTEQVDLPATALFSTTATDAILDTGASRCVMGKNLVKGFLNQLSEAVRGRVKMLKSSVRFRFGNNQTLLSDRRILMPFRTAARQVLWLSIEVVPGSTPLLFSKKAIKQLGGLIDTETDTCHLRRLQKSLRMRVGPTGLYLVDLARLGEESNLTSECLTVCEDDRQKALIQDLCMSQAQAPKQGETCACTASTSSAGVLKVWNSEGRSFKRLDTVNVHSQKPLGVSEQGTCPNNHDQEAKSAAVIANQSEIASEPCASSSLKTQNGSEAPSRDPIHKHTAEPAGVESRCPVQSSARPFGGIYTRRSADHATGEAGRDQDPLREGHERADVRGRLRQRASLGALDSRSHGIQLQDGACGVHHVCAPLGGGSRASRSCSASHRRFRRGNRNHDQGSSQGLQSATSPRGPCVGDVVGCRVRTGTPRFRAAGASFLARRAHLADGTYDATDGAASQPKLASQPELSSCLGGVWNCQRELETLVAQSKVVLSDLEPAAKQLLEQEASLRQCKNFLKTIPWHLLSPTSHQERTCVGEGSGTTPGECREPAYVMFGMFVHGGVTGVTRVSLAYPYLTRVLTRVVQLTNPQQEFSSVGVSVNKLLQPHRDSYNSRENPNIIIPIEYPESGGEIWVARPPRAHQASLDRQCGSALQPGSLQALKPGLQIDPHVWHASQPWSGNRSLVIAFCLKPIEKLTGSEQRWLRDAGFQIPQTKAPRKSVSFSLTSDVSLVTTSPAETQKEPQPSNLRRELEDAKHLLQPSPISADSAVAAHACSDAFVRAGKAAWDVFQDSQLAYERPVLERLNVLEVYAAKDSRLTQSILSLGGKAQRFTSSDGGLKTIEGQRRLWDVIQETQPEHVWVSPDCRAWCSWNTLNAARGNAQASRLRQARAEDAIHLHLCAQIFQ